MRGKQKTNTNTKQYHHHHHHHSHHYDHLVHLSSAAAPTNHHCQPATTPPLSFARRDSARASITTTLAITRSSNSSAIPPSEDVPFPESVAAHHPGTQTSVVLRYSTPAHQHRRCICTSCDPSTARCSEITWCFALRRTNPFGLTIRHPG